MICQWLGHANFTCISPSTVAARTIMRACCNYDAAALRQLDVRLAAPVVPGDTIVSFRANALERDRVELNNGRAVITTQTTAEGAYPCKAELTRHTPFTCRRRNLITDLQPSAIAATSTCWLRAAHDWLAAWRRAKFRRTAWTNTRSHSDCDCYPAQKMKSLSCKLESSIPTRRM